MFEKLKHLAFHFLFCTSLALFLSVNASGAGTDALFAKSANPAISTESSVLQNEQIRVELLALAPQGILEGADVRIGLLLEHKSGWHTYWKNPGDSGLPTSVDLTLPKGIKAGEIEWPVPKKLRLGSEANYGYEDKVLLPLTLKIGKDFQPAPSGDLQIKAHASWLVCKQECIPQDGNFVLNIPARGSTALHAADFESARAATPKPLAGKLELHLEQNKLLLTVTGLPADWQGKPVLALPEDANIAEATAIPTDEVPKKSPDEAEQNWSGNTWSASIVLSSQRTEQLPRLGWVFAQNGKAFQASADVHGQWPALPQAGSLVKPAAAASSPPAPAQANIFEWLLTLGAALIGGLTLNLMPCVFPVLAIKALGFAQHADHDIQSQRRQAYAYGLGVVLSFVALGALMLGLRAAGEQLGWGFQLQSPWVISALAFLFTLLGLNLLGVFEFGSLMHGNLASLQLHHPIANSFLSGVLVVAIASPCTAPFMGASIGFAIGLPALQALLIFAFLGLGLALPFVVLGWLPHLAERLPRPGAWMINLRRLLAFPMLATVVWLVWVLGHLNGVDGAASLLMLLLALSFIVWALNVEGRWRLPLAIIALLTCAFIAWFALPNVTQAKAPESLAQSAGEWTAWSPEKVAQAQSKGQPVFVDFTAAWCITCQVNKRTTLNNADVMADFRHANVLLLRADWTHRDPIISRALEQLGRSGVPVYVLYAGGKNPQVFSEILSVDTVRTAIRNI